MSAAFPPIALGDGRLRELTVADLGDLQALFERCADYFVLHEGRHPTPTEALDCWEELPDATPRSSKHVVGFFAPALAGVVEVVRDWPRPGTWIVGLLLLDPGARRRATGTRVMQAVDAWAAGAGAGTLRIAVNRANAGGLAFWRRLGFEPVAAVGADPAAVAFERPVGGGG